MPTTTIDIKRSRDGYEVMTDTQIKTNRKRVGGLNTNTVMDSREDAAMGAQELAEGLKASGLRVRFTPRAKKTLEKFL